MAGQFATKRARNEAMFADYLKGYSRAQVASKYGVTTVDALFARHGVKLSAQEGARRRAERRRKASYTNVGRKQVWPDCPADLADDYALLRRKGYKAAEARELLEPKSSKNSENLLHPSSVRASPSGVTGLPTFTRSA